jgi:hypothetical protein
LDVSFSFPLSYYVFKSGNILNSYFQNFLIDHYYLAGSVNFNKIFVQVNDSNVLGLLTNTQGNYFLYSGHDQISPGQELQAQAHNRQ